jgi:YegS/Rv2252/BmrU family lipid kinase
MPKYRAIINPYSHAGQTEALIPALKELLAPFGSEDLITESPGHAIELAAASSTAVCDVLVAIGGDGTVNEVVSGLMRLDPADRPVLAIIPSGSGNDTSRAAGLPLDITQSVHLLENGHTKRFDVGQVNDRYFFSSFSVGMDAMVVGKTIEYKASKGWHGSRLYYSALVYVILHELTAIKLAITVDDGAPQELGVLLAAITNGTTYGGGIHVNPTAVSDDGKLTFCYIDSMTMPKTLSILPLLPAAKHTKISQYHVQDFEHLTIENTTGSRLIAQTDGEVFYAPRFEVQTLPGAIEIIVPS